MLAAVRKALQILTRRERRRGALVLGMVVLMALLESAGVASVMPFLAVVGNPEMVESNAALARAYGLLGFQTVEAFLITLAAGSFLMITLAAAFRGLTTFAMARFTEMRRHSIGSRLLESYLAQPYPFFLDRHSADLAKSILSEADYLVLHVYRPAFTALAYAVAAGAIVLLLLIVDPRLAVTVTVVLGGAYLVVYLLARSVLSRIGRDRTAANRERFAAAGEALGAVKEIKLLGKEQAYLARFLPSSMRFARHQSTAYTLSEVPRYLVEALGVGGILVLTVYLISTSEDLGHVLPLLGLYAFAGHRLLRAAQHVYQGAAQLRFATAALDAIHADITRGSRVPDHRGGEPKPLHPARQIRMEGVSFTYPNAREPALKEINLTLSVGTSVGVVGGTGAGKTTLVDILLGLLRPSEGTIRVDGEEISESRIRAWQMALGYVPQDPFLIDASVAENIALGVPSKTIDRAAVERAARLAQIHEFVVGSLADGYDTLIGEKGVRLSGGQRQRIAIARALYRDPSVLVFDEATSALDGATEQAVMDAVNALGGDKTIILITHRLSTVSGCDKVVLLEDGAIKAEGALDDLALASAGFGEMLRAQRPGEP